MNYAVFNPKTKEVITVVTKPSGALPDGYEFVEESKLPAGWKRKAEAIIEEPVPTSDDTINVTDKTGRVFAIPLKKIAQLLK